VRILLVEDDERVADPLRTFLTRHGHDVVHLAHGAEALKDLDVDLILLDLGLPDLDGYEVCRQIRAVADVPIIVVTARSDEIDRVMGLQAGADDYVVKPYGYRELLARIEAVTRRATRSFAASVPDGRRSRLVVDGRTRKVWLDCRPIPLTRREFDLLQYLHDDFDAVRTREDIIAAVWDENWYGSTRTLDVHVASLRAKLGDQRWIETVRGVGFRLTEPS
jgi:two-component system, OmpR family, response regulator RegX3